MAAGEQAAPPADKVAALERELEETKQKVQAAEKKVEEAEAEVKEAKRSVENPTTTDISSYLQGLAPEQRAAVLADRRQELLRCSNALDKLRELLKSLHEERLALLQSQNRAGVTGAVGATGLSHYRLPLASVWRSNVTLKGRYAVSSSRVSPRATSSSRPFYCTSV